MKSKIVIIGGGIAGISALAKLLENGFKNVVLLEAENRIGGRVYTIPFADSVVDLGAQWCHGEEDNIVYEMVNKYDVLDQTPLGYTTCAMITSEGIIKSQANELWEPAFEILENCEEDVKNTKISLGSYFVKKYQEAVTSEEYKHIDPETAQLFLECFHKFENSIESSDNWFETSANGYLHYKECEGWSILDWKDKGYKTIIDFITKKFPDPSKDLKVEDKIQLNKEVISVNWMGSKDGSLTVKCSDGSVYDADHVIVTVSLGVLKENYKNWFTPQLPSLKCNAIEGLSIGTVDKIYLEWDEPFWNDDWEGFMLMWTKSDSDEIRKTENAWLEDVFGFWRVNYQPKILCGWVCGPSARKMELLDDKTILDGVMFLFDKFLKKTMKFTEPKRILPTRWYSNPHFRGSYSFRSLTTDLLKTSARDLSQPLVNSLGKPSLLFAGEATHDCYYSTVHGALESGYREAERLTEFYKKTSSDKQCQDFKRLQISNDSNRHYDVIVLGGGLSGLGAAEVLKDKSINFLLLEGQDKVGGRIDTVEMLEMESKTSPKILVENGAQWLHGKRNELYNLANELDLIRPELSEEAEGDYIRDDGYKFDDFFVKKVDFLVGQILSECEEFVQNKHDNDFVFPESLEYYLLKRFQEKTQILATEEEKDLAYQLLDWHRRFQIIDNSCNYLNQMSAKYWGNYSFNGENCQTHINIRNGLNQIPNYLHSKLKENILLKKKVVKVTSNEDSSKFLIQCADNSVFSCNHVICTFSIGVLKNSHQQMFSSPLPERLVKVIEGIGFGGIGKIYLHFEKKWWSDDWKGLQLVWRDELNDESHWTRYISGFDVTYPAPDNTLLAWIGGKGCVEMEKLSDQEIMEGCVKILRQFIGNSEIPSPIKFHCSRWNSNEFMRGSYSFTSKDCDAIPDWEEIINEPIIYGQSNKNILLFAGEACSKRYFSTLHGAFSSGISQSKKLLNLVANDLNFCHINSTKLCQSKL